MRVCSRCKNFESPLGTTLLDKKDATEYDLCINCLDVFKEDFLVFEINKKIPPKKKAE